MTTSSDPVVARTPTELGSLVRLARMADEVSQVALAEAARVGRQWLVAFEAGDKESAPLDMVMRVLAELGISVTLTPSNVPDSAVPHADVDEAAIDLDRIITTLERP